MSYIPDCRTDENYNEKYVTGENKNFLLGFDWCTQMAVDNFFDNNFNEFDFNDDYITNIFKRRVPDFMKEEYDMENSFMEKETEHRKVETYADWLRMKILEWIEMERNELITSMIDDMDEDEYKKIKAEVDGRQGKAED